MLEVRDVLKSYDGRAVVNRVSFEVQARARSSRCSVPTGPARPR